MIARLLPAALAPLVLLAAPAVPADAAGRRCDEGTAPSVTLNEIVRDYEHWRGRCVAVSGISDGTMLFTGAEAFRRARRLTGGGEGGVKDREDPERIGLNGPRLLRRVRSGPLREVTAYGFVSSCYDDYSETATANPEASIGFTGYCALAEGPLIHLRDLRVGRAVRQPRRDSTTFRR
jgi:hypothetical protein